ncbi:mitochondrial ribosome recycling factor [Cricetulus griseus]
MSRKQVPTPGSERETRGDLSRNAARRRAARDALRLRRRAAHDVMTPAPPPLALEFLCNPSSRCYHATLTRPISEISMKPVHVQQHDHRQYLAYPAVPVRQFATKKAKAKGKGQPQARVNINTALVEDIISLEEVGEEMRSVMEALKDNFNKTLNIRTAPECTWVDSIVVLEECCTCPLHNCLLWSSVVQSSEWGLS